MIYTMDELKARIAPVAQKYNLKAAYVFGSYARGEAKETSDVDILIDRTGADIQGLFGMGGLYNDLSKSIGKEIDLVTTNSLEQKSMRERVPGFINEIYKERVTIYE